MDTSSRTRPALAFIQLCRQSKRLPKPSNYRRASTPSFPQQTQSSHSTFPYDPSNYAKPLQRPPGLVVSPDYHYPRARPVTETKLPEHRRTLWTSIKAMFGWKTEFPTNYVPAPFNGANNPYRARKPWPPDFDTLHPKQQFHFEKTYRRRAKAAYTRPEWIRKVKITQHTLIVATLIYFVFFAEPKDMGTPFDGFRVWFFGKLKNLGNVKEETRREAERLEQESRIIKDQRARKPWFNPPPVNPEASSDENPDPTPGVKQ